ncbi:MAG: hypothetical protein KKB30_04645 [Proteobacteria bacterium]|nr:hypothetical protein [Pseudomonadota bacterium]MBU1715502.1 hypothetical protein [Pseudomonadota bacterium]
MAVPDFQSFFLPLLKYSSDGEMHRTKDINAAIAITPGIYGQMNLSYFQVTQQDSNNTPHASRKLCAPWGVTFLIRG